MTKYIAQPFEMKYLNLISKTLNQKAEIIGPLSYLWALSCNSKNQNNLHPSYVPITPISKPIEIFLRLNMDTKSWKLVSVAMAYMYIGTVMSCLIQYFLSRLTPTLVLQCGHSKDRLLRLKSEERKLILLPQFGHVIGFLGITTVHCLENHRRPSESFPLL